MALTIQATVRWVYDLSGVFIIHQVGMVRLNTLVLYTVPA